VKEVKLEKPVTAHCGRIESRISALLANDDSVPVLIRHGGDVCCSECTLVRSSCKD